MISFGNLDCIMRIRMSQEEFEFVVSQSEIWGITPSAYIRKMIDSLMVIGRGQDSHEDEQANINDKL